MRSDVALAGRPATGNKLVFSTSDFFRIENGKVAEHWDVVNLLARAVALGLVVPAPNPASADTANAALATKPRDRNASPTIARRVSEG